MKTKNIKTKEKGNWALPGNPIPHNEFKDGIKNAEEGPFYTLEESKNMLEEWRKKKNSR